MSENKLFVISFMVTVPNHSFPLRRYQGGSVINSTMLHLYVSDLHVPKKTSRLESPIDSIESGNKILQELDVKYQNFVQVGKEEEKRKEEEMLKLSDATKKFVQGFIENTSEITGVSIKEVTIKLMPQIVRMFGVLGQGKGGKIATACSFLDILEQDSSSNSSSYEEEGQQTEMK
jgi:hypothetical protein